MVDKVLFASSTKEWETPQSLFDWADAEWGPFMLDAAASEGNQKCSTYYDEETDSLSEDWFPFKRVWLNPPYGKDIDKWVRKAYTESQLGCRVVVLLPARTDTAWFHTWVYGQAELRFLRGRLKFGGAKNSAPFPSMIAIYG